MEVLMKTQEIISVLCELYKITGFRMSLHDKNFAEIAAYPPEKLPLCSRIHEDCREYDKCCEGDGLAFKKILQTKEPIIYTCRYGLTEAVSPLYNFGVLTGFLMMGQIRSDETPTPEAQELLALLANRAPDAVKLFDSTPVVSKELIESYVKIMTICAQYLTLSNALPSSRPTVAELAKAYIAENLDKRLTIQSICKKIGCSKTTLVSAFRREFNTTVNAAITDAKLEEAKKLLQVGKMSICEIAQSTGFYDQSYFSKVFSTKYGVTPSDYRRGCNK